MILVATFKSQTRPNQIAITQDFGDKIRLIVFDKRGPAHHTDFKNHEQLKKELRLERCQKDPMVGRELEAWTRTPEWATGLLVTQYKVIANTLSYHGHYDMTHIIALHPSIENALAFGARLCRELGYRVY